VLGADGTFTLQLREGAAQRAATDLKHCAQRPLGRQPFAPQAARDALAQEFGGLFFQRLAAGQI
jgi:hypothetical protein